MIDPASFALWVRLEAKPGKEKDVEHLLRHARELVDEEPGTAMWFALRLDPSTFAIFDTFPNEEERIDHLGGKVAAALQENVDLFTHPPVIEHADVIVAKLPPELADKAA